SARGGARGAVPDVRVGDQVVDRRQIALAPRPLVPLLDDLTRIHAGSIAGGVSGGIDGRVVTPTIAFMSTLVLTVIGDDRAGLVNAVAEVVARHGGNWERSQMAELAGKFAGIVLVTVPD